MDSPPPAPGAERLAWRALTWACRWALAVVFLMAALTKLGDLTAFTDRVVLRSGLPHTLAVVVAAYLPWLELTCGLCLALRVMQREAAALLALLLLVFLGQALLRPIEADCGCFFFPGPTASGPAWWPIVRNLLLLGAAMRACCVRSQT
jgi:putative oxidoreductase